MTQSLSSFASDIIEDIQSYGTIPLYTLKSIARNPLKDEDDFEGLCSLLEDIRNMRGKNYLKAVKAEAFRDDIVVTIEKR